MNKASAYIKSKHAKQPSDYEDYYDDVQNISHGFKVLRLKDKFLSG